MPRVEKQSSFRKQFETYADEGIHAEHICNHSGGEEHFEGSYVRVRAPESRYSREEAPTHVDFGTGRTIPKRLVAGLWKEVDTRQAADE